MAHKPGLISLPSREAADLLVAQMSPRTIAAQPYWTLKPTSLRFNLCDIPV